LGSSGSGLTPPRFRAVPEHIRSDNGPEFTAEAVREWLEKVGVKTLFIEPGSPWENGYNESFNGKLRDQLLNGEIFYTLREAQVMLERWRWHDNHERPHSSLKYRPPAPAALLAEGPGALARTLMDCGTGLGGRSGGTPAGRAGRPEEWAGGTSGAWNLLAG
jgi:putative transposase